MSVNRTTVLADRPRTLDRDDTRQHVLRRVRPDRLRVLLQFVLVRRLRRPGKEVHVVCSSQIGDSTSMAQPTPRQ